jgi:hypothetical protein
MARTARLASAFLNGHSGPLPPAGFYEDVPVVFQGSSATTPPQALPTGTDPEVQFKPLKPHNLRRDRQIV